MKNDVTSRHVLPVDVQVKKVIQLYVSLFKSKREAARNVDVNEATLKSYLSGSNNIHFNVFQKIVFFVDKNVSNDELKAVIKAPEWKELVEKVQKKQGSQSDHVMYRINPRMRKILGLYVSLYPSKKEASKEAGINHRTFKAYMNEHIKSFPRQYFWRIVELLEQEGYDQQRILGIAGAKDIKEILSIYVKTPKLELTKEQLIEKIIPYFTQGDLSNKQLGKPLVNAAKRLYGSMSSALQDAMHQLMKKYTKKIDEHSRIKDIHQVVALFHEYETCLEALYLREQQRIRAGNNKKKKETVGILKEVFQLREDFIKKLDILASHCAIKLDREDKILDSASPKIKGIRFYLPEEYDMSRVYNIDETIEHPGFGFGKVVRVKGETRMVVEFNNEKYGMKELLMNYR